MTELTLLTDQALGEGTDQALDGLGFHTYARVLADAAAGTPGPFTIGVFGEWGTGKTSLMRLVESDLESRDGVITVWFNAWRYEKEEHPIVPLVGTIVRALERHRRFLGRLADGGSSLLKSLRAVAYGFSAKSKVKVPGFAEIEAAFVAKDMIDRSDHLTPDPLLDRSLYYEAFESLSALRFPRNTRIVVMIDDLDRCFPDLAIRLLESIKLVLSQPGFIFVLGVARSVIEGYLQHRYQKEYGIADFQGHSYLDKIVQLPFHIPPHAGRMQEFSDRLLERVEVSMRDTLSDILPIIGSASGGNPRATIRFVNNLLIDLGINAQLVKAGLMRPIQVQYFAVSRCLQQRWPDTFSSLVRSDELCQAVAAWDRDEMRNQAASDNPEASAIAATLLSDRDLLTLLKAKHGDAWLTNEAVRSETIQFLRSQRHDTEADQKGARKRYDIFFSYATEDRKHVSQISEVLADAGIKVFMDTSIRPGEDWRAALRSALRETRAIGFCIGSGTSRSSAVRYEMEFAIASKESDRSLLIIPIILPGADWSMAPEHLSMYQGLDFSDGIEEENVRRLAKELAR